MILQDALDTTPAMVKAAMDEAERRYQAELDRLAEKYKADKAELRKAKWLQLKRYRRLLEAIEVEPEPDLPDATGGHAAVEEAAAEEVKQSVG